MDHQPDDGFFRRLRTCNIRGLRFSPTEPELMEYLEDHKTHLATGGGVGGVDHNIIPVLDLNILEPHDIPGKCQTKFPGDKQVWYLMHACPKKYQHSTREDRATPKGYWKATGKPTKVLDKQGRVVGTRKTLVFYTGRAVNKSQNEGKTEWIMHEFRSETPASSGPTWVICSISNKPAGPGPSPGPASPCTPTTTSGGLSDHSYSPGPPSVGSRGQSVYDDRSPPQLQLPGVLSFHTSAGPPPRSGGSSPVLQPALFPDHMNGALPPRHVLPDVPAAGPPKKLARLDALISRRTTREESTSNAYDTTIVVPTSDATMQNCPSLDLWKTRDPAAGDVVGPLPPLWGQANHYSSCPSQSISGFAVEMDGYEPDFVTELQMIPDAYDNWDYSRGSPWPPQHLQ